MSVANRQAPAPGLLSDLRLGLAGRAGATAVHQSFDQLHDFHRHRQNHRIGGAGAQTVEGLQVLSCIEPGLVAMVWAAVARLRPPPRRLRLW